MCKLFTHYTIDHKHTYVCVCVCVIRRATSKTFSSNKYIKKKNIRLDVGDMWQIRQRLSDYELNISAAKAAGE